MAIKCTNSLHLPFNILYRHNNNKSFDTRCLSIQLIFQYGIAYNNYYFNFQV